MELRIVQHFLLGLLNIITATVYVCIYEGPYLRGEGEGFAGLRISGAMGLRFPDSNLRSGLGDLVHKRVHVPA